MDKARLDHRDQRASVDRLECPDSPATMEIREDLVKLVRLGHRAGMAATARMDSLACPECPGPRAFLVFLERPGAMDQRASQQLDLPEQWVKRAMPVCLACRVCLANREGMATQERRAIVATLDRRDQEDRPVSPECQAIRALEALGQKETRATKVCKDRRVHQAQLHSGWAQKAQSSGPKACQGQRAKRVSRVMQDRADIREHRDCQASPVCRE